MLAEGIQEHLAQRWWTLALRGVVAVVFGILAIIMPGVTLLALVLLWGAYALVDGVVALASAFRRGARGRPVWQLVLIGILGIAAGIITFLWPQITAIGLLAVIAAWALTTGAFEMVLAVRLRKELTGEWLLFLAGALSVLFGILMIIYPASGALAVVWWIAAYAIFFGILLISLGFRLRRLSARLTPAHA